MKTLGLLLVAAAAAALLTLGLVGLLSDAFVLAWARAAAAHGERVARGPFMVRGLAPAFLVAGGTAALAGAAWIALVRTSRRLAALAGALVGVAGAGAIVQLWPRGLGRLYRVGFGVAGWSGVVVMHVLMVSAGAALMALAGTVGERTPARQPASRGGEPVAPSAAGPPRT